VFSASIPRVRRADVEHRIAVSVEHADAGALGFAPSARDGTSITSQAARCGNMPSKWSAQNEQARHAESVIHDDERWPDPARSGAVVLHGLDNRERRASPE
jgi:hypothetical protein